MSEPSEAQDQIVCPSCETPADPSAVVCSVCGNVLAAGIESEQATELLTRLRDSVQGRYTLGTAIGLGRAGITVRARRQTGSNRDVAIKVAWDASIARRDVVREADLAAQIVHPNVLPMTRIDVSPPLVAIEMPLVEAGTLGDLIDAGSPVPYQRVVEIVRAMAKALDEAHSRGVIHGALRPEKVHLDRDGNPLISGFMLGQFPSGDRDAPMPNTIGWPAYTAFEQRHNLQTIDGRADQFSLAVICYELLCGKRTWRIPEDGVLEIDAIEITPHRAIAPSVSLSAGAAIKRATWKDPSYRYDSINDFVGGLTGMALEGTPSEQLARVDRGTVKRRSPVWILVPLAALIMLAVLGAKPELGKAAVHWWRGAYASVAQFASGGASGPSVAFENAPPPSGTMPETRRDSTRGGPHNTRSVETAPVAQTGTAGGGRTISIFPNNGGSGSTPDQPSNTRRIENPSAQNGSAPADRGRTSPSGARVSAVDAGNVGSPARDNSSRGSGFASPTTTAVGSSTIGSSQAGVIAVSVPRSDPAADVYVDGQRRGKTPLFVVASVGKHVVSVKAPGGSSPASMPIVVTARDTVRAVFGPGATIPKQ